MAETKPSQRLTAERKFRIFLETRKEDAPVGEILRKYGLTLADLEPSRRPRRARPSPGSRSGPGTAGTRR